MIECVPDGLPCLPPSPEPPPPDPDVEPIVPPLPAAEDGENIPFSPLAAPIEIRFEPQPDARDGRGSAGSDELLEELADDSLEIIRRLKTIEQGQDALFSRLEQMDQRLQESRRMTAGHLETIRRELAGEQKSLSAKSAFVAVVSVLESLRAMHRQLSPKRDKRAMNQLKGIELALVATVQTLGFQEFQPSIGEPFDPGCMQSIEYGTGAPNTVLRVLQPGYRVGVVVVRPASVATAAPDTP